MHTPSLRKVLPLVLLLLGSCGSDAFAQQLYGVTNTGMLIRINTTTAAPTAVGPIGVGPAIGLATPDIAAQQRVQVTVRKRILEFSFSPVERMVDESL